jgi:sensor histidine kinase YesM
MKHFFKSFLKALLISIIILTVGHLIALTFNNVDDDDFRRVYVTAFILFFPAIFLSLYFFKIEKKWKLYFKTPILSFVIAYILIFLYFNFAKFRDNYSFFEITSLMNAIMSFFMALFVNFILLIRSKKGINNKQLEHSVSYSSKVLILVPVAISVIYSILVFIGSSSFFNIITIWSNLFPIGIILSFVSFYFFNKTYYKNYNLKLILFYLFATLICVLLSTIPIIFKVSYIIEIHRIYKNAIISIVLFGPYFLFLIIGIQSYYIYQRNKQIINIERKKSLESQLNYQQLKNQLSPHFLFNNINVLTSLIEENPKKAVSFSENLSHIYRYFLEQEKQDVVLVKEEISFAKSYLELLKDRFEVGLKFTIDIDDEAQNKYIVSTILQQVLENVVKHNEISKEHVVEVKISSKENYLIIENNINPKLKTDEYVSKKGIENIKQRIAFFTDDKVTVSETETLFTIALPILETV